MTPWGKQAVDTSEQTLLRQHQLVGARALSKTPRAVLLSLSESPCLIPRRCSSDTLLHIAGAAGLSLLRRRERAPGETHACS